MRRLMSYLLVVFFGLWPLTGALEASDDARLPACCRRHGAHHCAMNMAKALPDGMPAVSAPMSCPLFPGFLAGPSAPAPALTASMVGLPVPLMRVGLHLARGANALVRPVSIDAGRGPPAATMS